MADIVTVVSCFVTESTITLYLDDGNTRTISTDKKQVKELTEKILPSLNARKPVQVDMDTVDIYRNAESKTGIKFFRMIKSKVIGFFGSSAKREIDNNHGMINKVKTNYGIQKGVDIVTPEQLEFLNDNKDNSGDTVVAVVNGVPVFNAEFVEKQIKQAIETDNEHGLKLFMEGLAAVSAERKHTAQELLAFLKETNLPIAEDGSIIGYKVLGNGIRNDGTECMTDIHTGRVSQQLGSVVEMDAEMVDDDRRVLCSNGLHIARQEYLTSYGTDNSNPIVLCKIDPRDVISVPLYEKSKMRVRRYHIVAVLPKDAANNIRNGVSMTKDPTAAKILGDVIAGNHIGVKEIVHIGGAYGTGITVTHIEGEFEKEPDKIAISNPVETLDKNKPVITPKEINAQIAHLSEAARTGNMAMAISEPDAKPVTKAPSNKIDDAKRKEVFAEIDAGASIRSTASKTGVSARTIGRWLKERSK